MRLTVACPQGLILKAKHLAMVLGESQEDFYTFNDSNWQDTSGNLYSCASFEVSQFFLSIATSSLTRPGWDANGFVDMEAATDAQSTLNVWVKNESEPGSNPPHANSKNISVIGGVDGLEAIALIGLINQEDELYYGKKYGDLYSKEYKWV